MAAKNIKDELRKLDEQEEQIRQQRDKLREQAKAEALTTINAAIEELTALGYSYRLVEGKAPSTGRSTKAPAGTRRSGIRDQVLEVVSKASPDGIASSAVRDKLGITDKAGAQSVANALSALKRQGKIADKDGLYVAA